MNFTAKYFIRSTGGITINGIHFPHGEVEVPQRLISGIMEIDKASLNRIEEDQVPERYREMPREPVAEISTPVTRKGSCRIIVALYKPFDTEIEEKTDFENECLTSVMKHTDPEKHELHVYVNDGENLGAMWNRLIASSDCEYICLLNSDTVVEEGWLDKLIEAAEQKGGAVGPFTDNCGNPEQLAEKAYKRKTVSKAKMLSGFCLVFSKELWTKYGGFREDFPFYGQETNFLSRGMDLFVRKDVYIHHEGAASIKTSGRQKEERALSNEVYHHNKTFPWKTKLAIIGPSPLNPCPLWRGMKQAIKEFGREGMRCWYTYLFDESAREQLLEFDPDIVVTTANNRRRVAEVARVTEPLSNSQVILWNHDFQPPADEYEVDVVGVFDRIFLCWKDDAAWADYSPKAWSKRFKCPVGYMPQGSVIHPQILKAREASPRPIFIGSLASKKIYEGRAQMLEKLDAVYVNHFDPVSRARVEQESPQLYRDHYFGLAMSPCVKGYTSLRLYNILAYGGLALVKDFPYREQMFDHEGHVLAFNTAEEAKELMEKYLADEKAAETIRRRGWSLQQAKHTIAYRLMNIVSNVLDDKDEFWGEL
jgi:hypothetical protein